MVFQQRTVDQARVDRGRLHCKRAVGTAGNEVRDRHVLQGEPRLDEGGKQVQLPAHGRVQVPWKHLTLNAAVAAVDIKHGHEQTGGKEMIDGGVDIIVHRGAKREQLVGPLPSAASELTLELSPVPDLLTFSSTARTPGCTVS